jgi:hypothetical protein
MQARVVDEDKQLCEGCGGTTGQIKKFIFKAFYYESVSLFFWGVLNWRIGSRRGEWVAFTAIVAQRKNTTSSLISDVIVPGAPWDPMANAFVSTSCCIKGFAMRSTCAKR